MGELPIRVVAQCFASRAKRVAFLVGLVHHVHSIFVAQRVPIRVVRIVTGADEVDIALFDQLDVADHGLAIDLPARARMMLVPIDAFELYRPAVYQEPIVPAFEFADAHTPWNNFQRLAVASQG